MRIVRGFPVFLFATVLALVLAVAVPAQAGHGAASAKAKKGILLVSFGSTVPDARAAYDNIESKVAKAFPGVPVFKAFTSNIVRERILENDKIKIDSPAEAMASMMAQGFTHIAVQSLHVIPGEEYQGLVHTVKAFQGLPKGPAKVVVGRPLLSGPKDCSKAAKALLGLVPANRAKGEAVVFMGHGTHHPGNIYYPGMQWYLSQLDSKVFVGTVEGTPSLDDVMAALKASGAKTVHLLPLMTVAGDHAMNDMAGPEDDSWKTILTKAGYKVKPVVKGMGLNKTMAGLWVAHLKDAMGELQE